jgi:hypothetical protein
MAGWGFLCGALCTLPEIRDDVIDLPELNPAFGSIGNPIGRRRVTLECSNPFKSAIWPLSLYDPLIAIA